MSLEIVNLYAFGISANISTFGATLANLFVSDRNGNQVDVVQGHQYPAAEDLMEQALKYGNFFGVTVGRVCNRIANGSFKLNSKEYTLVKNNGPNCLHGGTKGFDKRIFSILKQSSDSVTLTYTSPDGEEGFPGTLILDVTYTIVQSPGSNGAGVRIDYDARLAPDTSADLKTPVNLTNHSYFNLDPSLPTVLDTRLVFPRNRVIGIQELNENQVPSGNLLLFATAPEYDFSAPDESSAGTKLGENINAERVQRFRGYDDFYVISPVAVSASSMYKDELAKMPVIAAATCESNGVRLKMKTTCPGFQLYTGNWTSGTPSKLGSAEPTYGNYSGFCLETSFPPDAINGEKYGWTDGVVIGKGEHWRQSTVYEFDTVA
ncbi:galactose mutarotase-like domain-containing protein [Cladochytrium replicatum]|nr:galactose mutarotase-like domain-containing protein [Cladochytrium replicatum]